MEAKMGDADALMSKPTWEQLEAMMPVVMAFDPLLEKLAEKKEKELQSVSTRQ
jgi:hypothetical protein